MEHEAEFDQYEVDEVPWPAVPEDEEEEMAEDDVPPVWIQEVFLQGWRPRAKVAPRRNRRGFLPPDQRPGAATPGERGCRQPSDALRMCPVRLRQARRPTRTLIIICRAVGAAARWGTGLAIRVVLT